MKKIVGGEPEQPKDKLDLVLESLNKNLEKISNQIGGGGGHFRKVNGEQVTSQLGYQRPLPRKKDAYGRPLPPPVVPIPRHLLPVALGGTYVDPKLSLLSDKEHLFRKQMEVNAKKNM